MTDNDNTNGNKPKGVPEDDDSKGVSEDEPPKGNKLKRVGVPGNKEVTVTPEHQNNRN